MRFLLVLTLMLNGCTSEAQIAPSDSEVINLPAEFLMLLQNDAETSDIADRFSQLDLEVLSATVDTREEKLAFWLNTYNAYVQHLLKDNRSLFDNRGKFFSSKQINIAGKDMSLDDLEHGIIRSSRWKLSLGYIRNPFAAKHIRMLRTKAPDGRVHFALNCGAASCPEIAIYHADNVDRELDFIAEQYLKKTTIIDEETVTVTPLMSWFRGDFGGKRGIKKDFLAHYNVLEDTGNIDLAFADYDWTLSLGNYTEIKLDE